jgi:hypothetical protein
MTHGSNLVKKVYGNTMLKQAIPIDPEPVGADLLILNENREFPTVSVKLLIIIDGQMRPRRNWEIASGSSCTFTGSLSAVRTK